MFASIKLPSAFLAPLVPICTKYAFGSGVVAGFVHCIVNVFTLQDKTGLIGSSGAVDGVGVGVEPPVGVGVGVESPAVFCFTGT